VPEIRPDLFARVYSVYVRIWLLPSWLFFSRDPTPVEALRSTSRPPQDVASARIYSSGALRRAREILGASQRKKHLRSPRS
jgi:hypothetical protein